jgi:hypothetical protein
MTVKREKANSKMVKKEQKQHDDDKVQQLLKEAQESAEETERIAA